MIAQAQPGDPTAHIAVLNDSLRRTGRGGDIMITSGVMAELTSRELLEVIVVLQTFDRFDADNDPHGEHDCTVFEALCRRFIFKIDTFDQDLICQSLDSADEHVSRRVLTLMLAEEY